MNQPYTRVSCPRDLGRKHMFFFNVSEDGTPMPNYCDDADGSDVCHRHGAETVDCGNGGAAQRPALSMMYGTPARSHTRSNASSVSFGAFAAER